MTVKIAWRERANNFDYTLKLEWYCGDTVIVYITYDEGPCL